MSFSFNWRAFALQSDFQSHIRELLTNALNKNKPHILEDKIQVLNLDWGNEAPSIEMLEIGDIAADRFRGVFKLNYNGGATITVATKVQANLLNVYEKSTPSKFVMPKFGAATASFPIPLHLTLRNIRLQGTVIVVFCKSRGLTLVFRNDPLQSIEVSSTFDTFPTIASFLQQQIDTQIRSLFREEVPSLLYQLSLKYLPNMGNETGKNIPMAPTIAEPVAFAEIDTEKPVSLVNMLHVEAMMLSRRTLALETPVMPTAIVRSELHARSLLTETQDQSLSMVSNDQSIYDQLNVHIRHLGQRHALVKPKRRVVVRLQKKEASESAPLLPSPNTMPPVSVMAPATPLMSSVADEATSTPISRLNLSESVSATNKRAKSAQPVTENFPFAENLDSLYANVHRRLSTYRLNTHPVVPSLVRTHSTLHPGRRLPMSPSMSPSGIDAKLVANMSFWPPSIPQAGVQDMHDVDELPPAYAA